MIPLTDEEFESYERQKLHLQEKIKEEDMVLKVS